MWISVESNFKQKHSESADLCKATSGPDLNDLQGTSLSKDTSQKNFHKILSVFCRDMSQIVEKTPYLAFAMMKNPFKNSQILIQRRMTSKI